MTESAKSDKFDTYIAMVIMQAGFAAAVNAVLKPGAAVDIAMGAAAIIAAATALAVDLKKAKEWVYLVIMATMAAATAAVSGFVGVYGGAADFINAVITHWNSTYDDGVSLVAAGSGSTSDNLFFCMAMMFLFSAVAWEIASGRRVVAAAVGGVAATVGLITIGIFSMTALSIIAAGLLAVWTLELHGKFVRRSVVSIVFICAISFVFAAFENSEITRITTARQTTADKIHSARYGSDTLPHGNLYDTADMMSGDEERLEVTVSQKKTLYLKGFTGGKYSSGKWEQLSGSAYGGEYSGMLSWLSGNSFTPVTQYSEYETVDENESYPANTVTVKNVGADRSYIYLPYSAESISASYDEEDDEYFRAKGLFGERKYSFVEYSGTLPSELMQIDDWVKNPYTEEQEDYLSSEEVYRSFVYDTYCTVDEDDEYLKRTVYSLFLRGETLSNYTSVYSVTERIRSVLSDTAVYCETTENPDLSEDPIVDFLTSTHEGNSAMFASAAVLAYREFGIPARYAEGYLLQDDKITGSAVTLTSKDSHAWVEVYIDGMGWLPIDVTPGFYSDTLALKKMINTPGDVIRTADIDESYEETVIADSGETESVMSGGKATYSVKIALGVFTLLLLALCVAAAVWIFVSLVGGAIFRRRYRRMDDGKKTAELCAIILKLTKAVGAEALPGWQTESTDKALAHAAATIREGDYISADKIMEKYLFGGVVPVKREIRLLEIFVQKLADARISRLRSFRLFGRNFRYNFEIK